MSATKRCAAETKQQPSALGSAMTIPHPPTPLKSIWICATGTRGDIQPFVAVGAALAQRGYSVTFFTNRDYVDLAGSFGLDGVALRGSNDEIQLVHDPRNPIRSLADMNERSAAESAAVVRSRVATHGLPDLALVSPMLSAVGWYLSVRHRVPHLDMTPIVASYNPRHMSAGLPTLPFGLHYLLLYGILVPRFYDLYRPLIRELDPDLSRVVTVRRFVEFNRCPDRPALVLLSPRFAQVLYPQPPGSMLKFVGTTVVEAEEQVARAGGAADGGGHNQHRSGTEENKFGGSAGTLRRLREFLDSDPNSRPIYLGWGSMHPSRSSSPERWVELCVRAVFHAQERAIVVGGEAGLSYDLLERAVGSQKDGATLLAYARDHVLFVPSAPHEWLFPQVAATVHHGGAGTTTAALRAGVPTIVTPVLGDQYDHSYLVHELGVGIGFRQTLDCLGWRDLGEAIKRGVRDPTLQARARQLRRHLLAEPSGAQVAAVEVEKFWDDYCVTGKFHDLFPGNIGPPPRRSQQRCSQVASGLMAALIALTAAVLALSTRSIALD